MEAAQPQAYLVQTALGPRLFPPPSRDRLRARVEEQDHERFRQAILTHGEDRFRDMLDRVYSSFGPPPETSFDLSEILSDSDESSEPDNEKEEQVGELPPPELTDSANQESEVGG